ncbi:hypothetical protein [Lunatimonas lonarensis]|uniref:hypothetical protein n=1 Tax=Lunatimonas lonarensis TaxID=1232681 RepID=UPI001EE1CCEB|nr:hypothetical protein [Lunatimonas lonarensis]
MATRDWVGRAPSTPTPAGLLPAIAMAMATIAGFTFVCRMSRYFANTSILTVSPGRTLTERAGPVSPPASRRACPTSEVPVWSNTWEVERPKTGPRTNSPDMPDRPG